MATVVVINFIGTIWGQAPSLFLNLPLRWFYTGMIFYFITCFRSCPFKSRSPSRS